MDDIKDVDIEAEGTFKYILIKVTKKSDGKNKIIVRGYNWAEYHGMISFVWLGICRYVVWTNRTLWRQ